LLKKPKFLFAKVRFAFNSGGLNSILTSLKDTQSLKNKLKTYFIINPDDSWRSLEVASYLPINGVREWKNYQPLKERIAYNSAQQAKTIHAKPISILNLDSKNLETYARDIKFSNTSNPLVSILIPVFEKIKFTVECLASISRAKTNISYEIIVSDDASSDETYKVLNQIVGISYIRNKKNLGFIGNCNNALKLCQGKFTLILNNDIQVQDNWLDGLVEVFNVYPDAGSVGPKLIYPSGHLQEVGVSLNSKGDAQMIGLNENPNAAFSTYLRTVDYCSGACLMVPTKLLRNLKGFSEDFAPAYYEDADLAMRIRDAGFKNYYTASVTVIHHLSKTIASLESEFKSNQILKNSVLFQKKWGKELALLNKVKCIAFYLPQFHEIKENNQWWGKGFTEWTNVKKARPKFNGHQQPRVPINHNYYDLQNNDVLFQQAELAKKYSIDGFCFYYYWFSGKRLLENPLETMLESNSPQFPFCLCWAYENWTRRWDGRDNEILISQNHSKKDDEMVIRDLIRYFKSTSYIKINNKPLLLVYGVDLFPNFKETASTWRKICKSEGIGEIYLAIVETHEMVHKNIQPSFYGCDASIEFPPLNFGKKYKGKIDGIDKNFSGTINDYEEVMLSYCARELPGYKRFRGVMPGWDNTARRQNSSIIFKNNSPGAFQAWLEFVIAQTNIHMHGDEKIIFINAWNEWGEGAYLEPDIDFGYSFLEAVQMAKDAQNLLNNSNG
jgi:GT2 family glycosyltransferase